jgi:hypothetical protein
VKEREREREREWIKNRDKAKLEGVVAYTCTIFIIEFTITHLSGSILERESKLKQKSRFKVEAITSRGLSVKFVNISDSDEAVHVLFLQYFTIFLYTCFTNIRTDRASRLKTNRGPGLIPKRGPIFPAMRAFDNFLSVNQYKISIEIVLRVQNVNRNKIEALFNKGPWEAALIPLPWYVTANRHKYKRHQVCGK